MISKKLLRLLPANKSYIVYDNIYTYNLIKYKDSTFRLTAYGYPNGNSFYIYEKDLEHLQSEARYDDNDDRIWHLKEEYVYNGYTNKYKCISTVGYVSVYSDFYGFHDINFFAENKGEETVKELKRFQKTLKSNRINTKYYKY